MREDYGSRTEADAAAYERERGMAHDVPMALTDVADPEWLEQCPHEPLCLTESDCRADGFEDAAVDAEDAWREERNT